VVEKNNLTVILRFVEEVFNNGNFETLDELASFDYKDHSGRPLPEPGREGWKKRTRALRESFPDIHMTIEDIFPSGDKVVVRYSIEGTHKGIFQGMPATGNRIKVSGINIARLKDGRIEENWNVLDEATMLRQLNIASLPSK
jgi:steroid delta-isomerase-like uncharacterized protein